MALIKCNECGSDVSEAAFKCPNCGYQLKTPKRGIMGKIFKFIFILFNIFMAIWVITSCAGVSEMASNAQSDAEVAGTAIGATFAMGLISTIWVIGDIILGILVLFTRPKSN